MSPAASAGSVSADYNFCYAVPDFLESERVKLVPFLVCLLFVFQLRSVVSQGLRLNLAIQACASIL